MKYYVVKWTRDGKCGEAGFVPEKGWVPDANHPHRCRLRQTAEDGAKMLAERGYETEVVEI